MGRPAKPFIVCVTCKQSRRVSEFRRRIDKTRYEECKHCTAIKEDASMKKVCTKCGLLKPVYANFRRITKNGVTIGRNDTCKTCKAAEAALLPPKPPSLRQKQRLARKAREAQKTKPVVPESKVTEPDAPRYPGNCWPWEYNGKVYSETSDVYNLSSTTNQEVETQ